MEAELTSLAITRDGFLEDGIRCRLENGFIKSSLDKSLTANAEKSLVSGTIASKSSCTTQSGGAPLASRSEYS